MVNRQIKVGIVGAGKNTTLMHIPKLNAMEGVEVISVCNRTLESSSRVAKEHNIPHLYENWADLVDAEETNAICIGTWPNMHHSVTMRALAQGKHVLTEARMAMNAQEAREMLAASFQNPGTIAQIVPFTGTFKVDRTISKIISHGSLGQLLYIDMRVTDRKFVDYSGALTWRQDRELSGYNALTMGMYYESLMRWVGPAAKVQAMTEVFVPQRRDATGLLQAVSIPDHIDVIMRLVCGAQARLQFSAITGGARGSEVWIFGSSGTLFVDLIDNLIWQRTAPSENFIPIEISPDEQDDWRVEEEFVEAIRGEIPVTRTSFVDGVRYMEFTEAVTRSSQTGSAIFLPL